MTQIKRQLEDLAATLAAYEKHPYDSETAVAVDCSALETRGMAEQLADDLTTKSETLALLAVVQLALDEDGFRFIPAARVLCTAVLGGF